MQLLLKDPWFSYGNHFCEPSHPVVFAITPQLHLTTDHIDMNLTAPRIPDHPFFVRDATDRDDNQRSDSRFAGAIVGGLSVFALFTLTLLYLLRRYRNNHTYSPHAGALRCTPLEWEPPFHSARYQYRDSTAYDHSTSSTTIHPPFSTHDSVSSQPQCWGSLAVPRRSQLHFAGPDDGQTMGAYQADAYCPPNAQLDQSPVPRMVEGSRASEGVVADFAEGGQMTGVPTRTQTRTDTDSHLTSPGPKDYPPSPHVTVPPNPCSTHSLCSNAEHPKSRYLAGRLSVILQSLDSLVEEMQQDESHMYFQRGGTVEPRGQNILTSLQRMRQDIELIRQESAGSRGGRRAPRTARDSRSPGRGARPGDAGMGSSSGMKHHSTTPAPGAGRMVDGIGDKRMPRPWVMA